MNPVALAVWLLVLGNLAASLSDVAVKMLQGEVVPFQYMFLRQLFAFALIWPVWRKQPKVLRQLHDPKVTLIRAHLVLLGAGCMVVAISYLPLATANAVFYAAPLLMLPLSILFLKETKPRQGYRNRHRLSWGTDCLAPIAISLGSPVCLGYGMFVGTL